MTVTNRPVHPQEQQPPPERDLAEMRQAFTAIQKELARVIVGQEHVVRHVLAAVLLNGHVLLEGVPGLGKTMLMSCLGEVLGLQASRVQFTPDLMPADILGTRLVEQEPSGNIRFKFEKGPVFTQILLADEINRATPKTQSALLEAMQERKVTLAGTTYPLPRPFLVMATQNPLEQEGTYPLPEAQLDRFLFKLLVRFPTELELIEIIRRTTGGVAVQPRRAIDSGERLIAWGECVRRVPVPAEVLQYASRLLLATHPDQPGGHPSTGKWVRYGASPRGLQAMVLSAKLHAVLAGRQSVSRDDINASAKACLRHRILLSFEAESDGVSSDHVVDELIEWMH